MVVRWLALSQQEAAGFDSYDSLASLASQIS